MAGLPDNSMYLNGKLLLAMPQMEDSRFERAVIFVCNHDNNGAMGLVINQVLPHLEFKNLLEQLKITSDIKIDFTNFLDIPVMSGGPVEQARGFLLHSNDFRRQDTVSVDQTYSVTGTLEALKEVAQGKGPDQMLFILGYAGWEAGQLEAELQQNAWLVVDPDPALIFQAEVGKKWDLAIQKLGFDPAMLSGVAGRA